MRKRYHFTSTRSVSFEQTRTRNGMEWEWKRERERANDDDYYHHEEVQMITGLMYHQLRWYIIIISKRGKGVWIKEWSEISDDNCEGGREWKTWIKDEVLIEFLLFIVIQNCGDVHFEDHLFFTVFTLLVRIYFFMIYVCSSYLSSSSLLRYLYYKIILALKSHNLPLSPLIVLSTFLTIPQSKSKGD